MTELEDRLLIVDASKSNRHFVSTAARRLGFVVAEATSVEALRREHPLLAPSAVLLGLHGTRARCLDYLKTLQDLQSTAKVMVLSTAPQRDLATAFQMGTVLGLDMRGAVGLPVSIDDLRRKLVRMRRGHELIEAAEIEAALEADRVRIDYEPCATIGDGGRWTVTGLEAKPHIHRSDGRAISLATEHLDKIHTGTLGRLTDRVVDLATTHLRDLENRGSMVDVHLHACPLLFMDSAWPGRLEQMLQSRGLQNSRLTLETTETAVACGTGRFVDALHDLDDHGFRLAIGNVGTGYCTIEQLSQVPCSELVVDDALLREIETGRRSRRVVDAVVGLAHALDMAVGAKAVPSARTFDVLAEMGFDRLPGSRIDVPPAVAELVGT